MLRGEGLSLVYRDAASEVRAVDGVDIHVESGEFVGIIGPSGSGKSSLLYILAGLKHPTRGRVEYQGEELTRMSSNERAAFRRRSFGFIFQNHFLIPYLRGIENVIVGAEGNPRERAEALLEELRVTHVRDKFPYQMSAGEKQRVAIARAILHEPAVVFADEPTASLDRANADTVTEHLERTAERGTLFVVTHDESILKNASRVLRMSGGKIA